MLKVCRGHRAPPGAQHVGCAQPGILQVLGIYPAAGREAVDDPIHVWNGRLEFGDRPWAHVAHCAPAAAVRRKADLGPTGRDRTIAVNRAVGLSQRRPEADLAAGAVAGKVPVLGLRAAKVLDFLPVLPLVQVGAPDLDRLARPALEDRCALQLHDLSRRSVRAPQALVADRRRVRGGHRAAPTDSGCVAQFRRCLVRLLILGRLDHADTNPVRGGLANRPGHHLLREVQLDLPGPVHAASAVLLKVGLPPAALAPGQVVQRRIFGDHALAFGAYAIQIQSQDVAVQWPVETKVDGIAFLRDISKDAELFAQAFQVHRRELPVDTGHNVRQDWHLDVEQRIGGKDGRLDALDTGSRGLDPGRNVNRLGLRRREPEGERHLAGQRLLQANAEQFHKLDIVLVRHLVQAIDRRLGHPCKKLDQCHARVADIVIGPFGTVEIDFFLGFVYDVLKGPVVEVARYQCHRLLLVKRVFPVQSGALRVGPAVSH